MTADQLYDYLMEREDLTWHVIEIFEGVRIVRFDIEEDDSND